MQLTWLSERRRFIGTQTEAKAEKTPFEMREVPTVKAELIDYLNGVEIAHEAELAALRTEIETLRDGPAEHGDAEDAVETDVGTPAVVTAAPSGDLIEQIMDLPPARLPAVLSVAIGRLGEIAGNRGWAAFAKDAYAWSPGARNVEQGLGMLMLAAFDTMGIDTKAKPARMAPITPVEGPQD